MIIERTTFTTLTTIGNLTVPGTRFSCYTLEDVARALGVKIYGCTAIPAGRHKCRLNMSNKFDRVLPLIYNTDSLTLEDGHGASWRGIRMHNGRNHQHTDGCPLLGFKKGKDHIYTPAADDLVSVLLDLHGLDTEFEIEIINRQAA